MSIVRKIKNRLPFIPRRRYCPVCSGKFSQFLPLPPFYEQQWKKNKFPFTVSDFETLNAEEFSCPSCGATDRDRIFCTFFSKETGFNLNKKSLLDIAPSRSLSAWIRKNIQGDYKTTDLFMDGVDIKGDLQNMYMVEDDTYDYILCSHVLEHVPDDLKAMKEIYRMLKQGGKAIFMVPIVKSLDTIIEDPFLTDISLRWKLFGQDDHIRLYNQRGLIDRLSNAGFIVKKVIFSDLAVDWQAIGIKNDFVLYIAHK